MGAEHMAYQESAGFMVAAYMVFPDLAGFMAWGCMACMGGSVDYMDSMV